MPITSVNDRKGPVVSFNEVLKGISAYDFLVGSLCNTGGIFDQKDGMIRIFTYNDIANNDETIDWSDKLINITEENTTNDDIGAQNYIKYKASAKYNGFGNGYFVNDLAVKLQKEDKNLIENKVFSFVNGIFTKYIISGIIPMFLKEATYKIAFSGDNGLWLVKIGASLNYFLINENAQKISGAKPIHSLVNQPTFDRIRATSWENYIEIQNKYRKVKAIFMLSPQDIAQLDFKKPIHLRQYAQAYIVTKVSYKPGASTVEMIQIR